MFCLFVFTRGGRASCLRACFDALLLPQSRKYPNLSEDADSVSGQLRGVKEYTPSVTEPGRVQRKVPESDARSVGPYITVQRVTTFQCVISGPMYIGARRNTTVRQLAYPSPPSPSRTPPSGSWPTPTPPTPLQRVAGRASEAVTASATCLISTATKEAFTGIAILCDRAGLWVTPAASDQ